MDLLAKPLTPVLDAFAIWTGNYGVSIIILTLLIRALLLPIQFKSLRSAARMRELQPKLKELQEKYKNNPEELQKRMMALYKQYDINPLSGCLPMLIQLPIIFGLYRVLINFPEHFASNPDLQAAVSTSFLGIDMLVPSMVMGAIAGISSFGMVYSMPGGDPAQRRIMSFMTLPILLIVFSLPAGVALYICVTNIVSALQQLILRPKSAPVPNP